MAKLSAKEIYEKEFSVSLKGYNQAEVDIFLDDVILDYQEFSKKIYKLEAELQFVKDQLQKNQFRSNTNDNNVQVQSNSNLDLLQRVANLEKEVFGNK